MCICVKECQRYNYMSFSRIDSRYLPLRLSSEDVWCQNVFSTSACFSIMGQTDEARLRYGSVAKLRDRELPGVFHCGRIQPIPRHWSKAHWDGPSKLAPGLWASMETVFASTDLFHSSGAPKTDSSTWVFHAGLSGP